MPIAVACQNIISAINTKLRIKSKNLLYYLHLRITKTHICIFQWLVLSVTAYVSRLFLHAYLMYGVLYKH